MGGAWPYHLSGSYQPMLYISTFNKREHPWRNLQKYPLPRPYFQSHCQKMPTESASEHLKTSHLKPQSMPQLSKSSNSSWLNQTFSPGMVETWYISFWSSFKKPLVATVARNCLFYSIPKARIMVDKFRIHLNTFRLKLSEHTNFCIDNQHCRHNCQTKTKYSDKKTSTMICSWHHCTFAKFLCSLLDYYLYFNNLKNLELRSWIDNKSYLSFWILKFIRLWNSMKLPWIFEQFSLLSFTRFWCQSLLN